MGMSYMKASEEIKTPQELFEAEAGAVIGSVAFALGLEESKARVKAAGQAGKLDNMSDQEYDDFVAETRCEVDEEIRERINDILWVLDSNPVYIYEIESLFAKLESENK